MNILEKASSRYLVNEIRRIMTKLFKMISSDLIVTLIGGMTIGFMAISFVEPENEGHKHIYDEVRAISVEQPIIGSS